MPVTVSQRPTCPAPAPWRSATRSSSCCRAAPAGCGTASRWRCPCSSTRWTSLRGGGHGADGEPVGTLVGPAVDRRAVGGRWGAAAGCRCGRDVRRTRARSRRRAGRDRLTYEGHPEAAAVLADVVAEAAARHGVLAVAARHRTGALAIGDLAFSWPCLPRTAARRSPRARGWSTKPRPGCRSGNIRSSPTARASG